jgi:transposase-like protein
MERCSDVAGLAAELGIDRGLLYKWNKAFRLGGAAALLLPGERPGGFGVDSGRLAEDLPIDVTLLSASPGTAELERKVAQQALELDFFRAALRHFAGDRRKSDELGETGSTP